jgi:hypothetical protein
VHRQDHARFARHHHRPGLHRQLELDPKQAQHVGDDGTGKPVLQLLQVPAEPRVLKSM